VKLPLFPSETGRRALHRSKILLGTTGKGVKLPSGNFFAERKLKDSMGRNEASKVINLMMRKDLKVIDSKVIILGFTFKEDCPDTRNTQVIDIYNELRTYDMQVCVYDPWADASVNMVLL
jgi:UDP-N-acetyl-D-galactosamine dehydrogenase